MKRFNSLCIKLSVVAMMLFLGVEAFAQKDVTKFLGIPVDGTREAMIQKLKAKGFKTNLLASEYLGYEILEGEFNGAKVDLFVVCHNNKVCRIFVSEKDTWNKTEIKKRYNAICKQFLNNPQYITTDQRIPEYEDISYEMTVNNKEYLAYHEQKFIITEEMLTEYFNEQKTPYSLRNDASTRLSAKNVIESRLSNNESIIKKEVYVRISDSDSKYRINIYYVNKYNEANGEDL